MWLIPISLCMWEAHGVTTENDMCKLTRCLSRVSLCRGPQVYKHKPKKHYQRKTGHRQPLSKFLVTKIA